MKRQSTPTPSSYLANNSGQLSFQTRPKSIALPKMEEVEEHEDEDLMSNPTTGRR
jgi:hypothetical protein